MTDWSNTHQRRARLFHFEVRYSHATQLGDLAYRQEPYDRSCPEEDMSKMQRRCGSCKRTGNKEANVAPRTVPYLGRISD